MCAIVRRGRPTNAAARQLSEAGAVLHTARSPVHFHSPSQFPFVRLLSHFNRSQPALCPATKMGVEVQTISPGDGSTFPKTGQTVVVHYVGTLDNGTQFDSSRDRGRPFKFRIGKGEVIRGWDEGVAQMSVGQRARLICSPDYAYGARGHPGIIPPNATLTFDVELLRLE